MGLLENKIWFLVLPLIVVLFLLIGNHYQTVYADSSLPYKMNLLSYNQTSGMAEIDRFRGQADIYQNSKIDVNWYLQDAAGQDHKKIETDWTHIVSFYTVDYNHSYILLYDSNTQEFNVRKVVTNSGATSGIAKSEITELKPMSIKGGYTNILSSQIFGFHTILLPLTHLVPLTINADTGEDDYPQAEQSDDKKYFLGYDGNNAYWIYVHMTSPDQGKAAAGIIIPTLIASFHTA